MDFPEAEEVSKDEPIVTIITPAHNAENTLEACIQSVRDAGYRNIEHVVVLDNCSDSSLFVCKRFPHLTFAEVNFQNASAARNFGLELSNGRFIKFLDADDRLLPGAVSAQVEAALATANDSIVYFGDFVQNIKDSPDGFTNQRRRNHVVLPDEVSGIYRFMHQRLMITCPLHRKSDLLSIGGFSAELFSWQEKNLHLRLLLSGKIFVKVGPPCFEYLINHSETQISRLKRPLDREVVNYCNAVRPINEMACWTPFNKYGFWRKLLWLHFLSRRMRQLCKDGKGESLSRGLRLAGVQHPERGFILATVLLSRLYRFFWSWSRLSAFLFGVSLTVML